MIVIIFIELINIIMNDLVFLQVMNLASITRGFLTLYRFTLTSILINPYSKRKQIQKDSEKRVR